MGRRQCRGCCGSCTCCASSRAAWDLDLSGITAGAGTYLCSGFDTIFPPGCSAEACASLPAVYTLSNSSAAPCLWTYDAVVCSALDSGNTVYAYFQMRLTASSPPDGGCDWTLSIDPIWYATCGDAVAYTVHTENGFDCASGLTLTRDPSSMATSIFNCNITWPDTISITPA